MKQGLLFPRSEQFAKWLKPEWAAMIIDSVQGGLNDYDNPAWFPPHVRAILSSRASANNRYDLIVHRFESALLEMPEFQMRRRYGHILIYIADTAVAAINKIDATNRLATPNRTRQSPDILSQTPLPMEDMPPEAQHIVFGYTVDVTQTKYNLYITCPSEAGEENIWELDLSDVDVTVFAAPAIEEQEIVDEPTGRVQLNEDVAKQVEEVEQAEETEEERGAADDSAR